MLDHHTSSYTKSYTIINHHVLSYTISHKHTLSYTSIHHHTSSYTKLYTVIYLHIPYYSIIHILNHYKASATIILHHTPSYRLPYTNIRNHTLTIILQLLKLIFSDSFYYLQNHFVFYYFCLPSVSIYFLYIFTHYFLLFVFY